MCFHLCSRRFQAACTAVLALAATWPAAQAQTLYICQLGGKAVYTSYPAKLGKKVRCQASALSPETTSASAASTPPADSAPAADAISQFWYDLEFGRINEHTPIEPRLPAPPPPKVQPAGSGLATLPPIAPPKLTPRQLVERDIAAEQRALHATQAQWQQARQRQRLEEAGALMRAIRDREQNIRALQEELRRFAPR